MTVIQMSDRELTRLCVDRFGGWAAGCNTSSAAVPHAPATNSKLPIQSIFCERLSFFR